MSIINVQNLRKSYPGHVAVDGVSLSVDEGEIFGILGPNGAGKTTTVECVGGLRCRDEGTISVAGHDPGDESPQLRKILGIQLQQSLLPEKITAREALELYASFYENPADTGELIERLGLAEHRDTWFCRLSGGQKQRLSVALALVGRPRVAILDELTTGLDPQARREVWALLEDLKSTGVTILLVSHFMEEAQRLCDRVAVIDRGRVVALDTPEGLAVATLVENRMSFTPSRPFDISGLEVLPSVRTVAEHGGRISVVGSDAVISDVIIALSRVDVWADRLRIEQSDLEDAFVSITAHDAVSTEILTTSGSEL